MLEVRALHALARHLGADPAKLLEGLASVALETSGADAAGISVLETAAGGGEVFRWAALAGTYAGREGGTVPANDSPGGTCLATGTPQHFSCPVRHFTALAQFEPPIVESLVVPLCVPGGIRATLWIAAHERRGFDGETVRLLASLAEFTTAVLRPSRPESGEALLPFRGLNDMATRKRAIIDSALDCIISTDGRGRIVHFNPAAERTFGYRHAEVVGRSIGETIVPRHLADAHNRGMARFLATGEGPLLGRRIELPARRADGSEFPVELAITAVNLEGGERFAVAYLRDITDRKSTEAALRLSEARFRAAFDQAAVGMIETDRDGWIRRVNDCFCRIVGFRREELVGRLTWELTYGPDLPENRRQFDQTVAATQPSHAIQKRYVRKDGSPVWTRVTASVVNAGPDADAYVLGVVEDITEQVVREQTRQFLLELSETTQTLTDPDELMQITARMLGEHLQVNRCAYAEVEPDADHFHVTGDYTRDTFSIVGRFAMSAFGEHALRLMRENRVYVVNDIDAETPAGTDLDAYRQTGIRAVICVPLHKGGRFVAGMAVHQATPRTWSAHEIELVRTVAERCWESIERARITRDLSASEERLRLALDAAEMGVWELDLATDRLTADERFRTIYGLNADEEITGLGSNLQRIHPQSRASVQAALEVALNPRSEGRRHTVEYRALPPDGSERWVLASGRVHFTGEGPDRRPARLVGTTQDITERKRLERELHHSAFHDPLTDLPNRALFVDRLAHVVARSRRHHSRYALLVLDIDNFKLVNDSFGHPAGDRLLIEMARVLRKHLHPDDTLARFGGDEFCILIEEMESREDVLRLVARIQETLKRQPLLVHDYEQVHAGISVGITFEGYGPRAPTVVMQDADLALYEAKRRGKGGHVVFDPRLRAGPESPLRLEQALQQAVARGDIGVAYQPVVELETGRAVGCEALARWHHPSFGRVEPSQFIAVAEQSGLILPLGERVLETACGDLARWLRNRQVPRDFYVAVNLSAQQLAQDTLVEHVADVLARHGLAGGNLRLEVTESSIVRTGEHAAGLIRQLEDRGIRVCVDDFGVGYSSLSYLQRFPVSVLKLDRSFIQGLAEQPGTRAIVQTVLDLARNLALEAVAEGIELPGQRAALVRMGFARAQGFLFHRPTSADAMGALARGGA